VRDGSEWRYASSKTALWFTCLVLLAGTVSPLHGQGKSASEADGVSASVQNLQRDYRFEVASIRPVGPPTGLEYPNGRIPPSYTPGHYRNEKTSLAELAMEAFRVRHPYQIEYPRWMVSTYLTVNATLPEGATKADLPIMIQHLLEDRFGLVFHHVTRQNPGYELVVGKSGPHLAKSAGPAPDKSTVKGPQFEFDKNGMMHFSKDANSGQIYSGSTAMWRGRNKTMQSLAFDLAGRLNVPVSDATSLEGEYDYTLTYTPGEEMYGQGVSPVPYPGTSNSMAGSSGASTPLEHPLLRDALQEQLGLKLEPVKNVPVDVVVVDSARREPTEN
jgi:uncharacterized protein (TIGR03435 family)